MGKTAAFSNTISGSRKRHLRIKITPGKVMTYLFLSCLVVFTSLPLIYLVVTSFKPLNELYLYPPRFFVSNPTTKNFSDLLLSLSISTVPFSRYIFNSLLIATFTVAGTVLVSTMGAYSLVKYHPPGSKTLFNIVIAVMMFSPHVTQIPRYLVVNRFGLINSYGALILPGLAVAYNFFLIKQFVEQFPDDLIEAARIDGCSEFKIYWKIVMPALSPAWATLTVFTFVSTWNDYFSPLIYLTDQAKKTLPLALNTISGGSSSIGRAGAVAAATMLMTIPTVIIFTLMQRKVMETMVHSGIKG